MLKAEIIGRIGNDAEVKTLGQNKVINFSVAHTQRGTDDKGQKANTTVWVRCTRFLPLNGEAKIADFLKKGTSVWVRGELSVHEYTGKDGAYHAEPRVRVSELELLPASTSDTAKRADTAVEQDESMPF